MPVGVSAQLLQGDARFGHRLEQPRERASRAPRSARPWYDLGKALDFHGDAAGALAAYAKGDPRGNFANWRGMLGRVRLLPMLEGGDAATRAVRQVDRVSWDADPWLVLEIAFILITVQVIVMIATATAIMTGSVFLAGLYPALRMAGASPAEALRDE